MKRKKSSRVEESRFDLVLSLLVLVPPVLLFGGAHDTVQLGLLVYYSVLLLPLLFWGTLRDRPLVWHPALLVTGGLTAMCFLQLVPLPMSLVDVLSPQVAAATRELDLAFGSQSSFTVLTLDKAGTGAAAGRWWALTLALMLLLQNSPNGRLSRLVPQVVLGLGAFVLVVAAAQFVTGTERVYGLFLPLQPGVDIATTGSFIGRNHSGQFLLIVAATCAALQTLRPSKRLQAATLFLLPACVVAIVANGSRGALFALAIGLLVHTLVNWTGRRAARVQLARLGGLVVIGLCFAVLAATFVDELRVVFTFDRASEMLGMDKLRLQASGLGFVGMSPWVGFGADALGAYQVALAPYETVTPVHFSFVENDLLQVFVDFGVAVPIGLLAAAIIIARKGGRESYPSSGRCWWVVAISFALCSLTSFALPILGLMIPVMGLLMATFFRPKKARLRRLAAFVLVVALGALSLVSVWVHPSAALFLQRREPTAVESVRSAPLDGRRMLAAVIEVLREGHQEEIVTPLLQRVGQLSGNDHHLQVNLAQVYQSRNDPSAAWKWIARAFQYSWLHHETVRAWTGSLDAEELRQVCVDNPGLVELILGELDRTDRFAELLQVSSALGDEILLLHYQVVASLGLNEDELANLLNLRLQAQPPMSARQCLLQGITVAAFGDQIGAEADYVQCLGRWPDDPDLLINYLRFWVNHTDHSDESSVFARDALQRLAARAAAEPSWEPAYWRLYTMMQIRNGNCAGARLIIENQDEYGVRPEYLPTWAHDVCSGL